MQMPKTAELDYANSVTEAGHDEVRPKSGASLHEDILSRLRYHIVEGNLAEGDRIPERELCERFGISRTPLREALKVLAAEGLIDLLPNRGARVRQCSEAHIP